MVELRPGSFVNSPISLMKLAAIRFAWLWIGTVENDAAIRIASRCADYQRVGEA